MPQRKQFTRTELRNIELGSDEEDTALRSKRMMTESPFHGHGAEPSQKQVTATPPLDLHRAESSQQHVRALNTQFASWVQSQLQNHPDELWEDGVQDYLAHASNILEKFSDVVNWLKANAAMGGHLPALGTQTSDKKITSENKSNETMLLPGKSVFGESSSSAAFTFSWSSGVSSYSPASTLDKAASSAPSWNSGVSSSSPASTLGKEAAFAPSLKFGVSSSNQASSQSKTASFANSWSSGVFSNSQTPSPVATTSFGTSWGTVPFKFGNQNTSPSNDDTTNDVDGENEEQPSSPSVKRTDEKGINVVHEVKCKLYVKSSDPADKDPWKDKGTGHLSIKCKEGETKGTKDSKPTILIRNDVGKIVLNALLYPGIKTSLLKKNSIVAIFHTAGDAGGSNDVVARTFLIKTKSEDDRNKLAEAIREYAPTS
ncbi:hypothetical protein Nepgr_031647 [Nepenthes gracilis]|uniref:RanBD1 domain-containing protein n=1 Tax=Nepenthes gracilis TaxID=150966 RepID=A0AAD3Y799_NEPGR|nr:hypothetical protein Nepgr_031647 [Nepenthes gracilis]